MAPSCVVRPTSASGHPQGAGGTVERSLPIGRVVKCEFVEVRPISDKLALNYGRTYDRDPAALG